MLGILSEIADLVRGFGVWGWRSDGERAEKVLELGGDHSPAAPIDDTDEAGPGSLRRRSFERGADPLMGFTSSGGFWPRRPGR
jgi:hypothetical protein